MIRPPATAMYESTALYESATAPGKRYIRMPPPRLFLSFFFLLHTYLVWVTVINKTVHHRLVPALHSAAEQFVQWHSCH
ncbi:unnamed protein product [Penicillium roqueforti FM164]|uniref:Genomic scaffold, ProqFM164S01 n=1 Tax=Penicillium roqueforti (strain FM164) TaxID=1365484 RepID=W6PXL4_PENRF|nr:unnamed protein product [Penicillium roqueforti FM164]